MKEINLLTTLTLFLSILLLPAFAQKQKQYIEKNKKYSQARIYKRNHKILKVSNLEMVDDSTMTFTASGSSQKEHLPVSDLKYVSVMKGSHALTYGLVGASSGLVGSLLGVTQADPSWSDPGTNAIIVVGITAGFGVIGALIGALNPKWRRLYFSDRSTMSFLIYPIYQGNSYGVSIAINL